ncbi:MAG: ATP-binding protein, partial [Anaerolineae bacterium]|nr:ATP-binding protein [Anaerolineae bacterium]
MNPFISEGSIVYGERFVGRREALGLIEDRVVGGMGCLAIVGQGRMGKSSLAYHALVRQRARLAERNCLVVYVDIAELHSRDEFFKKIVRLTRDELEEYAPTFLEEARIQKLLEVAWQRDVQWLDLHDAVQQLFKRIKRRGWNTVLIIDEFDAARNIFHGDIQAFQTLRELNYQPEWRVALVTLSRRSIEEVEAQSKAISNLHGIFYTYHLPRFPMSELAEMVRRVEEAGIAYSTALTEAVYQYTGGHPYLSARLLSQYVSHWLETHQLSLECAFQQLELTFASYYESVLDLLEEDKSDHKLLEIVCGPVIEATRIDARKLEAYQLI